MHVECEMSLSVHNHSHGETVNAIIESYVWVIEVKSCWGIQSTVDSEVVSSYGSGSELEWKIATQTDKLYTDQPVVYVGIFYCDW